MWIEFILLGVVTAAIAWAVQRRTWIAGVVSIAGIAAFVWVGSLVEMGPRTLGSDDWWESRWFRLTGLFAAMLAGMAIRYVTKAIEDRRVRLTAWRAAGGSDSKPGLEWDNWEFAYPLLVSAITFGVLLSQLKTGELDVANLLMSFQTGFFWQTLLAAKSGAQ